jgi:hypothetical protein
MLTGMGTHHFHPHAAAFSPSGKTGLRHNTKILVFCLVYWILCKNYINNTINHKTNKYFHFWFCGVKATLRSWSGLKLCGVVQCLPGATRRSAQGA